MSTRRSKDGGFTDVRDGICRWCREPLTSPRERTFHASTKASVRTLYSDEPNPWGGTWRKPTGLFEYQQGAGCVHEWLVRTSSSYLRIATEARDRGVCAGCGVDTAVARAWIDDVATRFGHVYLVGIAVSLGMPERISGRSVQRWLVDLFATWQADHIVPVVEGGGECGLDNIETVCGRCHRIRTAALAKRRAEKRRAEKASK